MLQKQRRQETLTPQEKTLSTQLAIGSTNAARQTLAPLEASEALQLLFRVVARDETKTVRKLKIYKRLLLLFFLLSLLLSILEILNDPSKLSLRTLSTPLMLLCLLWAKQGVRPVSEGKKTAAFLLPDLLPRLSRTDLPLVLELAPEANLDDNALFSWLGHGLGRMPTDELVALSPEARNGLCHVTQAAIEKSKTEEKAEPLAVAGLLALGSLKEPSLKGVAEKAARQHTRGHVCAAAEEYLRQL